MDGFFGRAKRTLANNIESALMYVLSMVVIPLLHGATPISQRPNWEADFRDGSSASSQRVRSYFCLAPDSRRIAVSQQTTLWARTGH